MKKIISLTNLSYSIPYGAQILENINLEVEAGEFIGILGHNGSGKTTLVDMLMGFRAPTEGSVLILEENPHASKRSNKNKVVFLSQEVSLKGNLSIKDFLEFHASFYPNYSMDDEKHLLEVFSLDNNAKIGSLSTGQQKKVQVVAGLSTKPELVIIDEITAVMDPETRSIFFNEIQNVRRKYSSCVILATNIAEDLIEKTERVLFISNMKASIHKPSEILSLFNVQKAS